MGLGQFGSVVQPAQLGAGGHATATEHHEQVHRAVALTRSTAQGPVGIIGKPREGQDDQQGERDAERNEERTQAKQQTDQSAPHNGEGGGKVGQARHVGQGR